MPYVHIQVTDEGVTRPQKAEMVARTTQLLTEILGKNAATTVIVIEEVSTDNWGIGGELVSARRAREGHGTATPEPPVLQYARFGDETYGTAARDRRAEALVPTMDGARAALETFYHAFNNRSLEVLDAVWAPADLISLYNPLGGLTRGLPDIRSLYRRIFEGQARVWVEFHDVVEYADATTVVFAGRERGEFARDGQVPAALAIRTSRVFRYLGAKWGWRQIHHHGSIDSAEALAQYREAARGEGNA